VLRVVTETRKWSFRLLWFCGVYSAVRVVMAWYLSLCLLHCASRLLVEILKRRCFRRAIWSRHKCLDPSRLLLQWLQDRWLHSGLVLVTASLDNPATSPLWRRMLEQVARSLKNLCRYLLSILSWVTRSLLTVLIFLSVCIGRHSQFVIELEDFVGSTFYAHMMPLLLPASASGLLLFVTIN